MAKKMSKQLVALSASAISVVYIAGYVLTEPAARQIAAAEGGGAAAALPTASPTSVPQLQSRTQERELRRPGTAPQIPGRPGAPSGTPQVPGGSNQGRPGGNAAPPAQPTAQATQVPLPGASISYRDGVYTGHGTSRRGNVDVAITVLGGKITAADITHSTLQYPVSRISRLPGQVVDRQGAQIDNVTGATLSARAFQDAVRQALAQAG